MPQPDEQGHRTRLQRIAHRVMLERGLAPDFTPEALAELNAIRGPAASAGAPARDLRGLVGCSIDNSDWRDLDQLSVAEPLAGGSVKLMVAIAEVGALVRQASAIDDHARKNPTSVYTAGGIFPMLPEKLSTDLTSLGLGCDRIAIVVEMVFGRDGALAKSDVYEATVR